MLKQKQNIIGKKQEEEFETELENRERLEAEEAARKAVMESKR